MKDSLVISSSELKLLLGLFSRGDIVGALTPVLENPPCGPGVDEAKVRPLISSHPPYSIPDLILS